VRTGGKAFLFLGPREGRVKLSASIAEAKRLAAKHPARCAAGAGGWVKFSVAGDDVLPLDVLSRWVDESHDLFAPKPKPSRR
jgi:hypothetical protein